jgi:hypothetical protein
VQYGVGDTRCYQVLLSSSLPVEYVALTPSLTTAYVVEEVLWVAAASRADEHYVLHTCGLRCIYLNDLALPVNLQQRNSTRYMCRSPVEAHN